LLNKKERKSLLHRLTGQVLVDLDDQIKQNATDKRVKKETNQLETVGHSSFMDSVKNITGKRKRKQKILS
jgi:hypothetical protein